MTTVPLLFLPCRLLLLLLEKFQLNFMFVSPLFQFTYLVCDVLTQLVLVGVAGLLSSLLLVDCLLVDILDGFFKVANPLNSD